MVKQYLYVGRHRMVAARPSRRARLASWLRVREAHIRALLGAAVVLGVVTLATVGNAATGPLSPEQVHERPAPATPVFTLRGYAPVAVSP